MQKMKKKGQLSLFSNKANQYEGIITSHDKEMNCLLSCYGIDTVLPGSMRQFKTLNKVSWRRGTLPESYAI